MMKCFLINEVRGYILILKVKPNRFNIKFYPGCKSMTVLTVGQRGSHTFHLIYLLVN